MGGGSRRGLLWGVFILLIVLAAPGVSAEKKGSGSEPPQVAMDFDEVDIRLFIKFISTLTGKNFVLDKAVKGTINVVSPSKVTPAEAYRVFESVLEVYGFTSIPSGDIIKIVPLREAKDRGVQTITGGETIRDGSRDSMVTQLITLKYADVEYIESILTPLVSKTSVINSDPKSNTLIVTDVQSNIRRLLRIIREIDIPGVENQLTLMELQHASAKELSEKILSLMEQENATRKTTRRGGDSEKVLKVIPVERINALVVLAGRDDTLEVRNLVSMLDRPTPAGRDNIHVYYLKNAVAEDLAAVLTQVRDDQNKAAEAGKGMPTISADVVISPDAATNALVVRSTPQEFNELVKIIQKLDIERAMVYVEGLIMEVNTTKALRLGVEWHAGNDFDNQNAFWFGGSTGGSSGVLGSVLTGLQADTATFSLPGGLALGVIGQTLSYAGITFPSYSALINAVKSDQDFNILSTPQILTTDNVEAEVVVADNIPYQTRLDQGTDITSRAISTFEYKDVGVTLKVTPQINHDRFVRMKIEQEVKNIIRESTTDSQGNVILAPVTNVRSTKTTVVVRDGETVVMGGLVQDIERVEESRVPCLGNIPGVGWLFKTSSQRKEKVTLLVFLTPRIIESTEEARRIYDEKHGRMQEAVKGQKAFLNPDSDEESAESDLPAPSSPSTEAPPETAE